MTKIQGTGARGSARRTRSIQMSTLIQCFGVVAFTLCTGLFVLTFRVTKNREASTGGISTGFGNNLQTNPRHTTRQSFASKDSLRMNRNSGVTLTQAGNAVSAAGRGTGVVTVAYVISLIKCGDRQSNPVGLTDAAIVLRHSVHLTSIRNPDAGSKYDYRMYALVHRQALNCSQPLVDAGFAVLPVDPPVRVSQIRGKFLRNHIRTEWCCGADEFIKLHVYNASLFSSEPIVVHVDIDFVFIKPMDDLFDAMLYDNGHAAGRRARARIPLETPHQQSWPEGRPVSVFWTRDWPQVIPGRKSGYQAGFLVVRPDTAVLTELIGIIRAGDYRDGWDRHNGWGGSGYGAFLGAMAMQGLLAYYYDVVVGGAEGRDSAVVELNQCRFNHMGMDVRYRSPPNFRPKHKKVGACRNDRENCEDCQLTDLRSIYSIHYTQCRKPWNCCSIGSLSGVKGRHSIDEYSVNLKHCIELITVWHSLRTDLENKLVALTGDDTIKQGRSGNYKNMIFQGHCQGERNENYMPLSGRAESLRRLPELYVNWHNGVGFVSKHNQLSELAVPPRLSFAETKS